MQTYLTLFTSNNECIKMLLIGFRTVTIFYILYSIIKGNSGKLCKADFIVFLYFLFPSEQVPE